MSVNWIEILKPSVGPFIIATWAIVLKYALDKPSTPSCKQPPIRTQAKNAKLLLRIAYFPFGMPLICVLENGYLLFQELRRTASLTRFDVFVIADSTVFILVGLVLMIAIPYLRLVNQAISLNAEFCNLTAEGFHLLAEERKTQRRDTSQLG